MQHKQWKSLFINGLKMVPMALLLASCGQDKASSPSQVMARVNGKEITVLQLNYFLGKQADIPSAQQKSKKEILDDLIQQELLVQLAMDKKLDRNPNVLQATEFARRQILAQAAISQLATKAAEPSHEDVAHFYKEHPELFADRKIYDLAAFQAEVPTLSKDIVSELDVSHSAERTESILKSHHIVYASRHNTVPAEELSDGMFEQMKSMKQGDITIIQDNGKVILFQLISATSSPLSLEQASPSIVNKLKTEQMIKLSDNGMDALRKNAKIEILHALPEGPNADKTATMTQVSADKHMLSGLDGLK